MLTTVFVYGQIPQTSQSIGS